MGKTNRSKPYDLNINIFGSREEEIILAKNIHEYLDVKTSNKMFGLINQYKFALNQVDFIPNLKVKREVLRLCRRKYFDRLDEINPCEKVYTFARNVMSIYYREILFKNKLCKRPKVNRGR